MQNEQELQAELNKRNAQFVEMNTNMTQQRKAHEETKIEFEKFKVDSQESINKLNKENNKHLKALRDVYINQYLQTKFKDNELVHNQVRSLAPDLLQGAFITENEKFMLSKEINLDGKPATSFVQVVN